MNQNVTPGELESRLALFREAMDAQHPDWNTALIAGKVNQYYFTGTMQDALLMIRRDQPPFYFVRRSFERAKAESPVSWIYPMESYRDAAGTAGAECGNTYLETETVTIGMLNRMSRHFRFAQTGSLDAAALAVRSVKSDYERFWMEESGRRHHAFLQEAVPRLLREGMSEADFAAELLEGMIKHGHQGICRFSRFETEMVGGQLGFGENSLYPTSFDGPGGALGMSAAVPLLGSRTRKLKKGDLVFVDVAFGMNGYHTDKTQVYQFGGKPSEEVLRAHRGCMEVEKRLCGLLKPGAVPEDIYQSVMEHLSDDFKRNFMGYAGRTVRFLGHGVGLHVDEAPVIAPGFRQELKENMAFALEPKKGMEGIGMVGVEDTYFVTPEGGRCITGGGSDIIVL